MIGPLNWIDLLFLVTIVLLIFNGFRNGAVFSLINLLSIPIAIGVAYFFGEPFALFFANNGLLFSPLTVRSLGGRFPVPIARWSHSPNRRQAPGRACQRYSRVIDSEQPVRPKGD